MEGQQVFLIFQWQVKLSLQTKITSLCHIVSGTCALQTLSLTWDFAYLLRKLFKNFIFGREEYNFQNTA